MLDDQPGMLARILSAIAQERGNIIQINHTQGEIHAPLHMANVNIELETRGWDHIGNIQKKLLDTGYEIRMV